MVQSKAKSVDAYLDELPDERRAVAERVLVLVRNNIPKGYAETMGYGGVCWGIPLETYPDTYNRQPLCYAAFAAQKNHYALYLMNVYGDAQIEAMLRDGFAKAGKKLDLGKSCLRFKKLEDLPLDVVAKVIAATPPKQYIDIYEASRRK
ncbi:MAG TPA: DUF1801 domain-containing protein [Thermoanaerobaculia bacterium]|nr:DUF1801 domain-containing protein [Thermoanaerobaculia bacterium]